MASDKFGSNPVAPLYNATGRNPRDVEMGTPGKALGSVGSSGAGGKDFGIPNQPAKNANLGASMFSPLNPYNMLYGNRGSGGGGGGGEADVDAMERIAKAQTPGTVNFAAQAGENVVQDSQYSESGDNYKDIQQKLETTPGTSAGTQPSNPRKGVKMTEEAKAKSRATKAEKREANPAYGRRNNLRPPRGDSPIARRRSAPSAPSAPRTVTSEQSIGNVRQKSTVGGNF